ncbi:phosphotransferase [Variovorax paradoxus]|uniref:Hydroxylysine kinase n=1 Tax=Variovorax paradoxus (strain EPS) TaxID=595537 RepID=E6UVQ5_VARPE|nr:phosphotransferase [Variovorax paradoxus]ADU35288.1 aminoglycoside phosphotransferase [Variovorax paradoxus EPS]
MHSLSNIGDAFTLPAPAIDVETAQRLVHDHYGISGVVQRLTGERDQNFRIRSGQGHDYLLKISHPAEDRSMTEFQTQALLHIMRTDPTLPVPHVIETRDGESEKFLAIGGHAPRIVRLLSYLQGDLLPMVPRSSALRQHMAATLARLAIALRGFFHPAAGHDLPWDLKHAGDLRDLLAHIPDMRQRSLAERFLDGFEEHARPQLARLRAQVVHNDLNDYNVLVDPAHHDRVAGILDFGDMVHTALINDLAIASSYQLTDSSDPLGTVAEFVAAYHAVLPLEPMEIDVLFDLMATRLVSVVAIGGWRAQQHPENRDYILRNNAKSWARLERCGALPRAQARQTLRRACNME